MPFYKSNCKSIFSSSAAVMFYLVSFFAGGSDPVMPRAWGQVCSPVHVLARALMKAQPCVLLSLLSPGAWTIFLPIFMSSPGQLR